jgi:hypothetical protein
MLTSGHICSTDLGAEQIENHKKGKKVKRLKVFAIFARFAIFVIPCFNHRACTKDAHDRWVL